MRFDEGSQPAANSRKQEPSGNVNPLSFTGAATSRLAYVSGAGHSSTTPQSLRICISCRARQCCGRALRGLLQPYDIEGHSIPLAGKVDFCAYEDTLFADCYDGN
jgi:hypothetical protein